MNKVQLSRLTGQQARAWLVANDPEAQRFWRKKSHTKTALIDAVWENLRDFGFSRQAYLHITSTPAIMDESGYMAINLTTPTYDGIQY
jgi:hypothetical protein